MGTASIIKTDGLTKVYKDRKNEVRALDSLNMDVPEGSIFGFLGPNGSGKSTTIRMLVGLAAPTAGTAQVAGGDIRKNPNDVRAHVGYLAQSPSYYNYMTGRETLEYVAGFYPWVKDPVGPRAKQILDMVGLGDAGDRKVGAYSGGMKQRLGIAQALIGRPSVLILDEPVSSLDPIGRHEVLEILRGLRGHTTVMFSTHILEDVQRVADHVAVLDRGKMITQAPTEELLGRFSQNEINVLVAATAEQATELQGKLAVLPTIISVTPNAQNDTTVEGQPTADLIVATQPGTISDTLRAIQRTVYEMDLLLLRSEPLKLDLESVFLKLVN